MYLQKDIMLRPLVDHMHWEIPFWRQLIKNVGMVPGTRESCAALMEAGEHVLVFPGGRREVCKQKGEAYQLIWRNRTGFAHMAVAHGYDIIPVATIGAEEMFDILDRRQGRDEFAAGCLDAELWLRGQILARRRKPPAHRQGDRPLDHS
jgi:1-acyl-sn-glycerol-3-phosphate acyltransferase